MAKHKNLNPDDGGLFDDFDSNEVFEDKGPVTVLGLTFENDDERRAYFRSELRSKLPELRKIEGFPIGSDDDIINLSDPPYYTACPNPWIKDFIAEWEEEKNLLQSNGSRNDDTIISEPYVSDISEGKRNPIYDAHTYHTKVPHPAIMRYILHYTQPGDIIFDGFCGSGMTGVAATMCNDVLAVQNLGISSSKAGIRHSICSDLSPVASFIAAVYNSHINVPKFKSDAQRILNEVFAEYGWMYKTPHDGHKFGIIKSVVWTDIFTCPYCGADIDFFKVFTNSTGKIHDNVQCPECSSAISKKTLERKQVTSIDECTGEVITKTDIKPVLINYSFGGRTYSRELTDYDVDLIERINQMPIANWFPTIELRDGYNTAQPIRANLITKVHQFYSKRNLIILSAILSKCDTPALRLWFNSQLINLSKLNRYRPEVSFPYNPLNGTLYIASQFCESNVFEAYRNKLQKFCSAFDMLGQNNVTSIASAVALKTMPDNCCDYIFTDPPFGANIMYSDLNSIWEGWLRVQTEQKTEAIVNKNQDKSLFDYQQLMYSSLREFYRILKPGKWITVEFSNTSAAIWNSIQTALQNTGFVVAGVSALDKQQGSFKAVTTTTAVKQDLIISCFKPSEKMLEMFQSSSDSAQNVWDFTNELLEHLPVHLIRDLKTTSVVERSPKILYDRLISYYVQRGLPVPIDAREFQAGLRERFLERDGMFFTADQAFDYENKKKATIGFEASQVLFVSSEAEGIEWLKRELQEPKTYADLTNPWNTAQLTPKKGDKIPELKTILEENFIEDEDGQWRVPDPEKEADLEKIRNRRLAHEFKSIAEQALKPKSRIKDARLEALRYGFKEAYRTKDFETIVNVAQHLPEALVMEDEELLRYYDIASSRV